MIFDALLTTATLLCALVAINIPLNNRLQALSLDAMTATDSAAARAGFERRWNRSNRVRTVLSTVVVLLLLFVGAP